METLLSIKKSLRRAFGSRRELARDLEGILEACGVSRESAHTSYEGADRLAVTIWRSPEDPNPLGTLTLSSSVPPGSSSRQTFVTLSMNHDQDQEHYNLSLDRSIVHVRVRAMLAGGAH
jgi:hypothetical protein